MTPDEATGIMVRRFRKMKGISQTELARRIGLARQAVCEIENLRVGVKMDTFFKIAEALEIGVEDMFRYVCLKYYDDQRLRD